MHIRIFFVLFLLLSFSLAFSQDNTAQDSISYKAHAYIAQQFAKARPLNIEFTSGAPYQFTSKVGDSEVAGNWVENFSQAKISSTFQLITKKKWTLGATVSYKYSHYDLLLSDNQNIVSQSKEMNLHYHQESINATYITRWFNRTTFLTSSFLIDGSDAFFGRAKGFATATMLLKNTEKTKMTAGFAIIIDPSANVPMVPTFTLHHQFRNRITADIIVPKHIMFRKHIFEKSRLSIGTEIESNSLYLRNINPANLSQKYEYRQVNLNSGITFEHLIGNHVILLAKTGVKSLVRDSMFKKENNFNDDEFSSRQESFFYFNVGLSFNPFIKNKKK